VILQNGLDGLADAISLVINETMKVGKRLINPIFSRLPSRGIVSQL